MKNKIRNQREFAVLNIKKREWKSQWIGQWRGSGKSSGEAAKGSEISDGERSMDGSDETDLAARRVAESAAVLLTKQTDAAIAYAWIDFSAYWLHRALHAHAGVYAALHRSHHVYQVPCAHAAFASHPADFLVFQLLGMAVLAFVRLHPLAFAFAAVPTAYHNQIEHSGLLLTGEMPWAPTPAFHDDHHAQYTCNFGFETTLWDWAFGTLRKTKGKYGEDAHEQAR